MMFKQMSVLAIALAATSAGAQEMTLFQKVGKWDVLIDEAAGNGCFASRSFDDGTLVQLGAVPAKDGGFFAAYNGKWDKIVDGDVGIIKFEFSDARFAGDVVGKTVDGLPGGYAFFDNPNIVSEFAKRLSVHIIGPNGGEIDIDLAGSQKAINAVQACQKEQPTQSD